MYQFCVIYTAQTIQAHLATLHQPHHTHHHHQQQQQQQRNLPTPSLQQILLNQNFSNVGRGSGKSGKFVVVGLKNNILESLRINAHLCLVVFLVEKRN
jgi:hypothetical protein